MSMEQMSMEKMSLYQMPLEQMSPELKPLLQMSFDQMSIEQMSPEQMLGAPSFKISIEAGLSKEFDLLRSTFVIKLLSFNYLHSR
jgi:hypothetical protein